MITELQLYNLNSPQSACIALVPLLHKCTQTLTPLKKEAHTFRDIYGHSVSLGGARFRYASIVSGQGLCAPSTEALSIGARLLVHCIQPIYTPHVQGETVVSLARPCVPGSAFLINNAQTNPLPLETTSPHRSVIIPQGNAGYLSYCPVLEMTLTHFEMKVFEDQDNLISWVLHLEEV